MGIENHPLRAVCSYTRLKDSSDTLCSSVFPRRHGRLPHSTTCVHLEIDTILSTKSSIQWTGPGLGM